MKKGYIKLNDSYSHLSIGNVINTIKNESKNKTSAVQSEVFCALFNIDYINESTVNNYCVGSRSIGDDYKQIYINLKKKYLNDETAFIDIIKNVLSLVEGTIYNINDLSIINKNEYLMNICNDLYNIAKNDFYVTSDFSRKLKTLINQKDYYNAFVNMVIYAVLEKVQPLYEDDKVKNVIQVILQNTDISAKELQDFLLLELNEGINFSYALNNLAKNDNSFANFQLGLEYYRGDITGTPDYVNAYKHFKKAANNNHPSAYWMIANMIIEGKLPNDTKEDKKEAIDALCKSKSLGNIAAINSLGLCYLKGFGVEKNITKGLKLLEQAASKNYAYAFNNLGKYYEDKDKDKSLNYYIKSANLKESYASNKVGIYYLDKKDYQQAFNYFNQALHCTLRAKSLWAYYNLAIYFYLPGCKDIDLAKDEKKAISYLEIASKELIEAAIELLNIYLNNYLKTHKESYKSLVYETITKIENHPQYNKEYKSLIENNINKLQDNINITI